MSNYNQSEVSGSKWTRSPSFTGHNQLNTSPYLVFDEEEVLDIGGHTFKKAAGRVVVEYQPTAAIPLRNPTTDELTGANITQAEIHMYLYSLYRYAAEQRDLRNSEN